MHWPGWLLPCVVTFINEIQQEVGAGTGTEGLSLSGYLNPYLKFQGELGLRGLGPCQSPGQEWRTAPPEFPWGCPGAQETNGLPGGSPAGAAPGRVGAGQGGATSLPPAVTLGVQRRCWAAGALIRRAMPHSAQLCSEWVGLPGDSWGAVLGRACWALSWTRSWTHSLAWLGPRTLTSPSHHWIHLLCAQHHSARGHGLCPSCLSLPLATSALGMSELARPGVLSQRGLTSPTPRAGHTSPARPP